VPKDKEEAEKHMGVGDESGSKLDQQEAGPITENPQGENGSYNADAGSFGEQGPSESAGDSDGDGTADGGSEQTGAQNPDLNSGHDTDGDSEKPQTIDEATEAANQDQAGDVNRTPDDAAAHAADEAASAAEGQTTEDQSANQENLGNEEAQHAGDTPEAVEQRQRDALEDFDNL
jgi:hypothetical protein